MTKSELTDDQLRERLGHTLRTGSECWAGPDAKPYYAGSRDDPLTNTDAALREARRLDVYVSLAQGAEYCMVYVLAGDHHAMVDSYEDDCPPARLLCLALAQLIGGAT
jgi:hypothetical protein